MSEKVETMDDRYGDGSDHAVCEKCGFCKDCGDCAKWGCGRKSDQPGSGEGEAK